MTTEKALLRKGICVFLFFICSPGAKAFLITNGLVEGAGNNVCRTPATRAEAYDVTKTRVGYTVYYTSCGFIYWSRCTRYRQVTRYYTQRLYRIQNGQKFICCTGWQRSGNTCRIPICVGGCGNGQCATANKCICNNGWTGSHCNEDFNECTSRVNSSSINNMTASTNNRTDNNANNCSQVCINNVGSYTCGCYPGYRINVNDSALCDDINECHENNQTCTCSPPGGATPTRPCNTTCENTIGSFLCRCSPGYHAAGGPVCTDINECAANISDCSQRCFNTGGSYYCGCYPGYKLSLDNHTCYDINECRLPNHGCEQICVNDNGTYHCECRKGFVVDSNGKTCSDHDECNTTDHGCSQICNNYHATYNCSCRTGYRLLSDKHSCEDIDECKPLSESNSSRSSTTAGCQQLCHNINGSFVCLCRPGFALLGNGKNCTDIDECTTGTHRCDQNCHNSVGSYDCSCQMGFILNSDNYTCRALPCKEKIVAPVNGRMKCSGYTTNETCSFICNPGYNGAGSFARVCLQTGKWSGQVFTCQAKKCPRLIPPKNAFIPTACHQMRSFGLNGCDFHCMEGYFSNGNGKVTCNVTESLNNVEWITGNFSCKAIKPCKPNPCLHEGSCNTIDMKSFRCDCTNTGYVGDRCQIGIVSTPEIPKLKLGIVSEVQLLQARPSKALLLSIIGGETITVSPSKNLSIHFPNTSVNFTITASKAGLHFLSYHLSGPSKSDFKVPGKSVFLVKADSSSRLDVFEKQFLVNRELPSGKYSYQESSLFRCNVTFSSTDRWQKIGGSIVTSGIVYANSIPLFLLGANLSNLVYTPKGIMQRLTQKTDVTTESGFDFVEYLQHDSFLRSFIKSFNNLAPHWFSAAMAANSARFSVFNTMSSVGATPAFLPSNVCNGFPSQNKATTALVFARLPAEIIFSQRTVNISEDSFSCFAVDLCSSELFVGLSNSNTLQRENLLLLRDMWQKGWDLKIHAFGFWQNGYLPRYIEGISWNGINSFTFAPFQPRIWLRGVFRVISSSDTIGALEVSVVVEGQIAMNLTSLDDAFKDGLRQKLALSIVASKAAFSIKAQALNKLVKLQFSSLNTFGQGAFGGQEAFDPTCRGDSPQGLFFSLLNTSNPWKNSSFENTFIPSLDDPMFLAIHHDMSGGEQTGIKNAQKLLSEMRLLQMSMVNFKVVVNDISKMVPAMKPGASRWSAFINSFETNLTLGLEMLNKSITHSNIGQFESLVKNLEEHRQFANGLALLLNRLLAYYGKYYLTKDLIQRVETFRHALPSAFSLDLVISNVTQTLNGVMFLMTVDFCIEHVCLSQINATIAYPVKPTCVYKFDTSAVSPSDLAFVLHGRMKQGAALGSMIHVSNADQISVFTKRRHTQKIATIEASFDFLKLHQKVTLLIVDNVLSFRTEGRIFSSYDVVLNASASLNITNWSSLLLRVTGNMNKTSKLVKQLHEKVQTYSKKLVYEALHRINVSEDALDRAKARRTMMESRYNETTKQLIRASLAKRNAEKSLNDAKMKYLGIRMSVSGILGNNSNFLKAFEQACLLTTCNYSCLSACKVDNIQEQINTSILSRECETKFRTLYIAQTINMNETNRQCEPVPITNCGGFCAKSSSTTTVRSTTNSFVLGKISLAAKDDSGLFGGCLFRCYENLGPCKMVSYSTVSQSYQIVPNYLQEYECSDFKRVSNNNKSTGSQIVPRCKSDSCIRNLDPNCLQEMNRCRRAQQQIKMIMEKKNITAVKQFESLQKFATELNTAVLTLEAAKAEEDLAVRKNQLTYKRLLQLQKAEYLVNVSLGKVRELDEIGAKLSRHLVLSNNTVLLTVENIVFAMETKSNPEPVFPVDVRVTAYTGEQKVISVSMNFERINSSLTVAAEQIVSEFFSQDSVNRRRKRSVLTAKPPVNVTENRKDFSDCTFATSVNAFLNEVVKSLFYIVNSQNETNKRLNLETARFTFANVSKISNISNDMANKSLDVVHSLQWINLTEILKNLHLRQSELLLWNETLTTWRGFVEILTNAKRFDGCFSFSDCLEFFFVRLDDLYRFQDVSEGEQIRKVIPKIKERLLALVKDDLTTGEATVKIAGLLDFLDVAQDYFVLCGEKPRIILGSPTNVTALEGESVGLRCYYRSHTTASVRWLKNGKEILGMTKKTLNIKNITLRDGGAYNCKVSNRKGSVTSNVTLVKIEKSPQITRQPVSVSVTFGGNEAVEFICNASGDPRPTFQWFLLRENKAVPEILTGYTQPRFYRKSNQIEQGYYYCEANNRNGVIQSDRARLDIVNATLAIPRVQAILNLTTMCNRIIKLSTGKTCSNTSLPGGTSNVIKKALINFFNIKPILLEDFYYQQHGALDASVTFSITVERSSFFNSIFPSFDSKARVIDRQRRKMIQLLVQLYKNIINNTFIATVSGSKVVGVPESLEAILLSPKCDAGQRLHKNWLVCANCAPGWYENGDRTCLKCSRGSYQPIQGQTGCNPCPPKHTTLQDGAVDASQCYITVVPTTKSSTSTSAKSQQTSSSSSSPPSYSSSSSAPIVTSLSTVAPSSSSSPSSLPSPQSLQFSCSSETLINWKKGKENVLNAVLKELSQKTKIPVSRINSRDSKILKDRFEVEIVFPPEASNEALAQLKTKGFEIMYEKTKVSCRFVETKPLARKDNRKSEKEWLIPVVVVGAIILILVVLVVIYVIRKRKLKGSGSQEVPNEFWNVTYDESPIKEQVHGSKQRDELPMDDLGIVNNGHMKENDYDSVSFTEDMNSLRNEFENPMFESKA